MINISRYMNQGIKNIVGTVLLSAAESPRKLKFAAGLSAKMYRASRRRSNKEKEGMHIPPFLIASIVSHCNLRCAGCYARANGACGENPSEELSANDWDALFSEAETLGISFILLAGGEPLLRPDILKAASSHTDLIFPVFTNGTLIDSDIAAFFDRSRNLLPVISFEGEAKETDKRRGAGVSQQIDNAVSLLAEKDVFFGASVTVTSETMELVTSLEFVGARNKDGYRLIIYVEYVPVTDSTNHLVLNDFLRANQEKRIQTLKKVFPNMLFLSFPGDEKYMGGCLAAGRGFFHINAQGGAEPCPFSPFSDANVKELGLMGALNSPLFTKLRDSGILAEEHTGGCTLFQKEELVKELSDSKK